MISASGALRGAGAATGLVGSFPGVFWAAAATSMPVLLPPKFAGSDRCPRHAREPNLPLMPHRRTSWCCRSRDGTAYRGVSTQNSLPSGSARTTQATSPWPMSTSVAPRSVRPMYLIHQTAVGGRSNIEMDTVLALFHRGRRPEHESRSSSAVVSQRADAVDLELDHPPGHCLPEPQLSPE